MMLQFPNQETFRLVLASSIVPAEVVSQSANVSTNTSGAIVLEAEMKLTKKAAGELTRLGITSIKRHLGETHAVSCWLQVVPTERVPQAIQVSHQTPVLLELQSEADLPIILGEMLRLGNDRQSVRRLMTTTGDDRVLLRVVGPPYYTLLRAFDESSSDTSAPIRAYLEVAPRVWVQYGRRHPYAQQINPSEGQLVLIHGEQSWTTVPDAPFQDVYEILKFDFPETGTEWANAKLPAKLTVPLRLVAGNAAEAAELWVLQEPQIEQLDTLIRDTDERITQRLKFAYASGANGERLIVVRLTASKLAPPVLPFTGVVGYKPYYKLQNLFVPVGKRLHPVLRRDVVRKLLADNPDELVWLAPSAESGFTPHTLPEDSFRPLEEWVEYILETNHTVLSAWIGASRFEFENFLCSEQNVKPKPPDDKGSSRKKPRSEEAEKPLLPSIEPKSVKKEDTFTNQQLEPLAPLTVKPPSEWMLRRKELETAFLSFDGALDLPERTALWPDLAEANAGAGEQREAMFCMLYTMWDDERSRARCLRFLLNRRSPVSAQDFDAAKVTDNPTPDDICTCALMWLLALQEKQSWVKDRLTVAVRYFEVHEAKLPLRLLWLLATATAKQAGADTLGLARTRDRLLQRLLEEGIRPERDLPLFLRSTNSKDSERYRQIRGKAQELYTQVRNSVEAGLKAGAGPGHKAQSDQFATLGYVDMMFAYAFAKLDEPTMARTMMETGRKILEGFRADEDRGITASFLFAAYRSRVEQAIAGLPPSAGLEPALQERLDKIHEMGKSIPGEVNNPNGIGHYAIMRLREQSNILERHEKTNPYHDYMKEKDELRKALTELPKLREPAQLQRQIRHLYRDGVHAKEPSADDRFLVLVSSLPLAGRVGEGFTVELLGLVPEAMKALMTPAPQATPTTATMPNLELAKRQAQLLEHGLMLAANYDRREIVQQLCDQFIGVLQSKVEDEQFRIVNIVAGRCLKSLRKLGQHSEIQVLLNRMETTLFKNKPMAEVRKAYATLPDLWSKALQSLLYIAGGRLNYGLVEQAEPVLELARTELLGRSIINASKDYAPLAQAYIHAVAQGPAEAAMPRLIELFQKMEPTRVQNSFTTSKFYSRFHLNIVEEVVNVLISDDFALGNANRKWPEEEEFLVRQRIHADMRNLLAAASLS